MFDSCPSLISVPLFDTTNVTDTNNMFCGCSSLTSIPLFDTAKVTNMNYMFGACRSLTSVPLFDTHNMTDMSRMFYGCYILASVPLFDTTNVTYMSEMFKDCYSLTSVPLFDTAKVTNMSSMFYNCYSLKNIEMGIKIANIITSDSKSLSGKSLICIIKNANNTAAISQSIYMNAPAAKYVYEYSLAPTESWMDVNDGTQFAQTWLAAQAAKTNKPKSTKAITLSFASGSSDYKIPDRLEYKSLTITADDVLGRDINTTIYAKYIVDIYDGVTNELINRNAEITEYVKSSDFPQNTSETDTVERTIIYSNHGLTASCTITQGVWINSGYNVDLNSQWVESTKTLSGYDVFMSNSNKGVNDSYASMKVEFTGIPDFKLYINSYAESIYDYTIAWNIDTPVPTSLPSDTTTGAKANTSNKQLDPTSISNFTKVSYPNDGRTHYVWITYIKDSEEYDNDDRGYIAIPKI